MLPYKLFLGFQLLFYNKQMEIIHLTFKILDIFVIVLFCPELSIALLGPGQ